MSKYTYKLILDLNGAVNMLKNHDVSVASITNIIKFKAEAKQLAADFDAATKMLCEDKHKIIPNKGGGYSFTGHPNEAEVRKDYAELQNTEIELKTKLNFMTEKELVSAATGLDMGVIALLFEYLVKTD
jgi:hypothetical protein